MVDGRDGLAEEVAERAQDIEVTINERSFDARKVIRDNALIMLHDALRDVLIDDKAVARYRKANKYVKAELICSKIVAWEWIFEPFEGMQPRVTLEQCCEELGFVEADQVRLWALRRAKAPTQPMPKGYREKLLAEDDGVRRGPQKGFRQRKKRSIVSKTPAVAAEEAVRAIVSVPATDPAPLRPAPPVKSPSITSLLDAVAGIDLRP